ncbi:hypothetical protein SDC9_114049 [bioreactor metagenome]|uniref:Uncharacterized protein n=1 Tax=bioreactor metagenome TaxID=1076179 RepID=A0A645BPK0_9ZZZZ
MRKLALVDQLCGGNGHKRSDHQRAALQSACDCVVIPKVVDKVDRDIREIHIKADEVYHHHDEHPEQLAVFLDGAPVENLEQLLEVSRLVAAGLEIRRVLHGKQRNKAKEDDHGAHDRKEWHVVELFYDYSGNDGSENGCNDRHNGECAAKTAAVMLVRNIRRPDREARVIAERTEKAHDCVGKHNERSNQNQRRFRHELAKPEDDGKHAPEDVPDGDERLSAPDAVAPCADQEGAERRNNGADADHPADDSGIGSDFVVNECAEPGVFHVPADLPGHTEHPDEDPVLFADVVLHDAVIPLNIE